MDRTFLILLEETRLARERAEEAGGRLEDFCNRSTGVSRFTQDGIRGKGRHSDPTAREVIGRLTLEQNYSAAVAGLLKYKARLERDIEADPFPDMKRVLYWRIICDHPWAEVCRRLDDRYTVRGLQRAIRMLIATNEQGRWRRMLQKAL